MYKIQLIIIIQSNKEYITKSNISLHVYMFTNSVEADEPINNVNYEKIFKKKFFKYLRGVYWLLWSTAIWLCSIVNSHHKLWLLRHNAFINACSSVTNSVLRSWQKHALLRTLWITQYSMNSCVVTVILKIDYTSACSKLLSCRTLWLFQMK